VPPSSGLRGLGRDESSNFLLTFQPEESSLFSGPVRTLDHILVYCDRRPWFFFVCERGTPLYHLSR
jgi:hypothetical protein